MPADRRPVLSCLALAALLGAAWLGCVAAFVPAARGVAKVAAAPPGAAAAAAGLALPALTSQPALAADSPPGWPYVVVFLGVFAAVFVLPNVVFKGR
mmetsp:Transcript_122951/g.333905  ORF Transcript_122951/g.333905 Transcript_122951/m.333905 type:complete len:97 (+) Transcript_122951:113-403(+)